MIDILSLSLNLTKHLVVMRISSTRISVGKSYHVASLILWDPIAEVLEDHIGSTRVASNLEN